MHRIQWRRLTGVVFDRRWPFSVRLNRQAGGVWLRVWLVAFIWRWPGGVVRLGTPKKWAIRGLRDRQPMLAREVK